MEHKDFLYNTQNANWLSLALSNTQRLYHVKMKDTNSEYHHFIFKVIPIEKDEKYHLISMDDITELGLLKLFDKKQFEKDKSTQDMSTLTKLLQTVQRNSAEVKMYNLYKGVTIVNKGLVSVSGGSIELRVPFMQQKAAFLEKKIILSCELFPSDILCKKILKVNFDKQTILVDDLMFIDQTPLNRNSVRLVPEENHTANLFYQEHKFGDGVKVLDISREAVKISLIALPSGLEEGQEVVVDMVFKLGQKNIIINSGGKVYSIKNTNKEYNVVINLEPTDSVKKVLIDYLAKRQMALIREFKGLNYEK